MPQHTRTVAVANQKGGVAKTTTVSSLGVALAELGQAVLVVDLDPQACLTFSLGVDPEDLERSVHDVLARDLAPSDAVVAVSGGIDLLPATIDLARSEAELLTRSERELVLRRALGSVTGYDWILLDCPPSLGILTVAALTAATDVLIPLQCETLAHRGVGQLLDTVYDVREYTNSDLRVLGVLPTLFDARTKHAHAVVDDISATYGVSVLGPPIPKSVRFAEAPAGGRSLLESHRTHRGAMAYRQVAQYLIGEHSIGEAERA